MREKPLVSEFAWVPNVISEDYGSVGSKSDKCAERPGLRALSLGARGVGRIFRI